MALFVCGGYYRGGGIILCYVYMLVFLCFKPLREILKLMFLAPPPPPFCCSVPPSARLASRVERIQPRTANTRNTENRSQHFTKVFTPSKIVLTDDKECVDVYGGVGRGLHLLEYF